MVCRFVFSTNAMLNNYKTYYIVYLIKKLLFIKSASIHAYFSIARDLLTHAYNRLMPIYRTKILTKRNNAEIMKKNVVSALTCQPIEVFLCVHLPIYL